MPWDDFFRSLPEADRARCLNLVRALKEDLDNCIAAAVPTPGQTGNASTGRGRCARPQNAFTPNMAPTNPACGAGAGNITNPNPNDPAANMAAIVDQILRSLEDNGCVEENRCRLWPEDYFRSQPSRKIIKETQPIIGGPFNGQRRATGIEARLDQNNITGGQVPDCDPAGWNPNANTRGQTVVISRTHLLANILGGPGTCSNLVTACQTTNQAMFNQAESQVLARVRGGYEVDYEVEPNYDGLRDAVPSGITIQAISQNNDDSCWTLGPITIRNPTNLQQC